MARSDARRNYVAAPPVRKGPKLPGRKIKPTQKTKAATESLKLTVSRCSPAAQHDEQDMGLREANQVKMEEQAAEVERTISHHSFDIIGACGGDSESTASSVMEEDMFYNVELAEAMECLVELIPILNFTFHCPE